MTSNTRLRRFLHALASGYAQLIANTLYVLASVPLALRFLEKREFGLWALALQLTGYLQLIDLGMSSSVSRHLIDYKDVRTGGAYGGMILTGSLVLLVQGILVLLGGAIIVFFGTHFLRIDADLERSFKIVMFAQCAIVAADFPLRLFGHILIAHQRNDLFNYSQIAVFAVGYAVLWYCFAHGFGLYSLIWANAAGCMVIATTNLACCTSLSLFPPAKSWGRATWARFRELFGYGKDLFWIALGTQMITASQTIVVTRILGLDAAATWSICTRTYTFANQLVWRPFDISYPALSEMVVRGEKGRLLHRFKGLVILTTSLAVVGAVMFALCNRPFVNLWTHGRISWGLGNDFLLALWMLVLALVHCHCGLATVTKRIGFMRYIYFVEGASFLAIGSLAALRASFSGLLITSIACSLVLSCSYGIWRTMREFDLNLKSVVLEWMTPPARLLVPLAILALFIYGPTHHLNARWQLGIYMGVCGGAGLFLLLRHGLGPQLREELLKRAPLAVSRLLNRLFPLR